MGRLGADFRQGIAEPLAGKRPLIEETFLFLATLQPQPFQHEEMILRDLAD